MSITSLIFIGVLLFAFGFAVGNARRLEPGKLIFLLIVMIVAFSELSKDDYYTLTMLVSFVAGFVLPYLPDMGGIGERISEIINQVRYRDAYEDIKRKEEEVEALRKELRREEEKRNAEQTRRRRERQREQGQEQRQEQPRGDSKRSRVESEQKEEQRQQSSQNQSQRTNSDPQGDQDHKKQEDETSQSQRGGSLTRRLYLMVLDLDPDNEPTLLQIKRAHRRAAMKYHPDRHEGKSQQVKDDMEERFKGVQAAYEWLVENAEE